MPSILNVEDKETVKKTVPKPSNKIHAVAVARLYVAYPDRRKWAYTGLQGAAVLANDLVANTLWIKMVDISPARRGVIWDQEIYDGFSYNQDRTFFHTFELGECLAGFSFADEKEAKTFRKKIDDREKNAHRNTRSKPFSAPAGSMIPGASSDGDRHHSRLGSLFGYRHSAGHHEPSSSTASVEAPTVTSTEQLAPRSPPPAVDLSDPAIVSLLDELKGLGITEDQIQNNADFINSYIIERSKEQERVAAENAERRQRAPPPPPPAVAATKSTDEIQRSVSLNSQHTGSSLASARRGPPPTPPPSRRTITNQRPISPVRAEQAQLQSSPPLVRSPSRFRAPPPIADAGKFAQSDVPAAKERPGLAAASTTGPPPPPRPPRAPVEDADPVPKRTAAPPPPLPSARQESQTPLPTRTPVPPAPPAREPPPSIFPPSIPPAPPALPTKASAPAVPPIISHPPPSPPKIQTTPPEIPKTEAPPPPSLPPPSLASSLTTSPVPPPPAPPPPPVREPQAPPLPPTSAPAPPPPPPPPPPFPAASATSAPVPAPPPPPPPPATAASSAPIQTEPLSAPDPGRGSLLADIRGGPRLKKVDESERRDRSAAIVPGAASAAAGGSGASASAPAADGGLAGALASALAARKAKVSHSDDEDDKDDW